MKIAVFHNLPSGGAKRALYSYVKYLTKSGHTVDVFIPSTADEKFLSLKDVSDKFFTFPVRKTITGYVRSTISYLPPIQISLADLEKTQKIIASKINESEYDIVYSEQDQYTYSPFFLKFIKKPTIYYCNQPCRFHEAILQKLYKRNEYKSLIQYGKKIWDKYFESRLPEIDKENASFAKYILANSYFSRESILRSYGLNSFVCYLGVDTETFKSFQIQQEDYVLSVGSCTPSKGFDFIIKSLGLIDQKIRPKLIIISNSIYIPWKKYLEKIAIQNKVELKIITLIEDEELVQFYNKAKLVLYAPYLEPFGLVPLEAMGCGTPVIAVKEGGIRESILHNETGILTERDEKIFADSVKTLLLDDKRRTYMGQKGIEVVRNFWTLEHAGERLLWHLDRVVKDRWG